MNTKGYAKAARKSLTDAARQFDAGDDMKGSQKMWDAAEHAVVAIALERGWEHSCPEDLFSAASMLSDEFADAEFVGGFMVAEKFRDNAEYDFMEDFQFDDDRQIVRDFVARTLALVE